MTEEVNPALQMEEAGVSETAAPSALPTDKTLVLIVCADPYPDKISAVFDAHGSVIQAGPDGPEVSHFLEMEGRMRRIFLQQLEVFSSGSLGGLRKQCEKLPKTDGGAVHLQILESPLGLLVPGFARQEIKLAGLGVGLDFLIPLLPVFFGQPAEKLGDFLAGKALDLYLEPIYS